MKRDTQIPWGKYEDNKFVVISLIRCYLSKACQTILLVGSDRTGN